MANSPPRRRHDSPSHLQYQSVHTGMTLSGVSECAELLLAPLAYRAELVMHLPRPEATTTTMVALSRTQGPRHSRAVVLTPSTATAALASDKLELGITGVRDAIAVRRLRCSGRGSNCESWLPD